MKISLKQFTRKTVLGLAVLVIAGYGAYRLVQIGAVEAATTPCIITVFGVQYDITALQNAHTGGNIFTCGADMTAIFQNQHGIDVSRIAPYLIPATPSPTATLTPTSTPGGGTPTLTPAPTPTGVISPTPPPLPVPHIDDDDEQEGHDDRQEEVEEEHEKDHTSSDARHEDED